jgi:hypothetical protein
VYVVHGTQRFLDHVGTPKPAGKADPVTTRLGSWYATLARWRPNVALFVSEATLLPVLVPAAPASTTPQTTSRYHEYDAEPPR